MWSTTRINTRSITILLHVNDLEIAFWSLLCFTINNDIAKIQELIYCNKLSLNVSKSRYMVFTPRHRKGYCSWYKDNWSTERTPLRNKFMALLVDSQLTWKHHKEYTCKMLSKVFLNRFETYNDIQSQYLHVPYDRLDVKMFRFNVHGANVWNTIPDVIMNVQTTYFNQSFYHYLIECTWFCSFVRWC